jgi:hypothetical protein
MSLPPQLVFPAMMTNGFATSGCTMADQSTTNLEIKGSNPVATRYRGKCYKTYREPFLKGKAQYC